jgi:hypothetical protein
MTLHLRLFNVDDGKSLIVTTIDTNTRKTLDLTIDPADLATTFIALNALLGTLEAHLHLQHLNKPAA